MVTVPSGSESQVAFISGTTDAARLAATAFATWKRDKPATYQESVARELKWGSSTLGSAGGTVTYWFDGASQWTATEQSAIESSLALWSAVANISFTLSPSEQAANQVFFRTDAGAKNAFQRAMSGRASTVGSDLAGTITKSEIHIDTSQPFWRVGTSFDVAGGYGWQTVVHEIGHMLGLGHGGPYNGNVDVTTQQFSAYDTRAWTLMSYIDPTKASAKFFSDYPVTVSWGVAPDRYFFQPTTPMVLDILAIQRLYGAPTSGPLAAGGQVFGFNSNIEGPAKRFFDFTDNKNPVITIWDGGTNNTLDLSGFSKKSVVDLNPGKFSSTNGMTNNIAIAMDTIVESVVGGGGNDSLTGSSVANTFRGNAGDDTIDGGSGTDTAIFAGLRSAYTLTDLGGNTGVRVAGPDGSDTLTSVEKLKFDDVIVDWPLAGGDHADALTDESNAFGAAPVGESVDGSLETAADRDWFVVELTAGTVYTINLSGAQDGNGTLANPHLRLRNSAGAVVAENDDVAAGSHLDSRITYVPTETGTFYIEAGAFADSHTGTFELTITSPTSGTDDFADSLGGQALPFGMLTAGGSSLGTLEVPTDRDWFAVQLAGGTSYSLSVTGAQGGGGTLEDPYLRLRDGSGALIGERDDSADGTSTDSQLNFTPTATGTYYIEVGSYRDSYAGTYTVGLSAIVDADDFASVPAELTLRPVGQLAVGGAATGNIEEWGDRDWFAIQVTAGKTYNITVTGAEASAGVLADPYVILHDGTGRTLAESDDDLDGVDAEVGLSFIAIESGTYHVEVAAFLDLVTGTYTVGLTEDTLIDDAITRLYAAYCDRAPDAAGAEYWQDQLQGGMSIVQIARSFSVQPEPGALYGFLANPNVGDSAATEAFLEAVYGNLFNRTPDPDGEVHWMRQLQSGATSVATILLDILSGAQAGDALVIANKVTVGNYYVAQTFNHQVPMTVLSARDALEDVDSTAASALAAQAEVDAFIAAVEDARHFPDSVPAVGVVSTVDGAI